jgi:hypothetical protein
MGRRVRRFSLIATPVLFLGIISLAVQLIFFKGSSNFFLFDFNSGLLWKSDEASAPQSTGVPNVIREFFPERILPENFAFAAGNKEEIIQSQQEITKTVLPRTIEVISPKITKTYFLSLQMNRVESQGLFELSLKTDAMKRLESITLFNPNIQSKKSKIAVGFSFAPSFTFRSLKYLNNGSTNGNWTLGQSEKYRNQSDKKVLNFYGGLDVYFQINPRLNVQTGIYYSAYGEQITVAELVDGDPNLPNANEKKSYYFDSDPAYCSPETYEAEVDRIPFTNNYRFVEIPVLVNYKLTSKMLIYEVQAGISISSLNKADALIYDFKSDYYYWVNRSDFILFNKYFWGGQLGFLIRKAVSPRMDLFVNPQFKYLFTPSFNEIYSVEQHQYATGLRVGLKFHL